MRPAMRFRSATLGLLALWLGTPAAGWSQSGPGRMPLGKPEESSYLEMTSVFSVLPPMGYAPVLFTVRNDTPEDVSFKLTSTAHSGDGMRPHQISSQDSFGAPLGKLTQHFALVPICPDFGSGGYGGNASLSLQLTGPRKQSWHQTSLFGAKQPIVAFSSILTNNNVEKLNKDRQSAQHSTGYGSEGYFATQYKAEMLPPDWRAFTGLDVLAMTGEEWLKLAPGVRSAVLHWVHLGGKLDLYAATGTLQEFGFQKPTSDGWFALGLGTVSMTRQNGTEMAQSMLEVRYPAKGELMRIHSLAGDQADWRTQVQMGLRSFNDWKVALILLVFGILVGPVNLFYFAKSGQRHRLFFTTPVISLGASLLLILVIFFQDGMGGHGGRFASVYINARDSVSYVQQQQVSRTGMLFGSSYSLPEPSVVTPLLLEDSRWTRLKPDESGTGQNYQAEASGEHSGDWFQSRSEQGQWLMSVRSTRGRLELEGTPAAPALRSNLGYSLKQVWYIDDVGTPWQAPALATGQAATLEKSTVEAFIAWRNSATEMATLSFRIKLRPAELPRGHFFSSTEDPAAGLVDTLKSIHWNNNHIYLWGELSRTP